MQVAYAAGMTKERAYRENRRYWLARWAEEAGGPKRLAELADTVDTHLIAMIRGRRNVGDDLAEKIERKLGHDFGAMDLPPPDGQRPAVVGHDLIIPQYDAAGSTGTGLVLRDLPGMIQSLRVTPEWVQRNVRNITSVKNLAVVTGFGDSMRPLYNPGDPLLVDRGVKSVDFDGIYFFRIGDEGFIKRLQRIPGVGLRAISENKAYESWDITKGMDFEVFARVVKIWKGEDF